MGDPISDMQDKLLVDLDRVRNSLSAADVLLHETGPQASGVDMMRLIERIVAGPVRDYIRGALLTNYQRTGLGTFTNRKNYRHRGWIKRILGMVMTCPKWSGSHDHPTIKGVTYKLPPIGSVMDYGLEKGQGRSQAAGMFFGSGSHGGSGKKSPVSVARFQLRQERYKIIAALNYGCVYMSRQMMPVYEFGSAKEGKFLGLELGSPLKAAAKKTLKKRIFSGDIAASYRKSLAKRTGFQLKSGDIRRGKRSHGIIGQGNFHVVPAREFWKLNHGQVLDVNRIFKDALTTELSSGGK